MKIETTAVHVVGSHGLGEQRKFKILSNAHSFRILSSGLYSDKISACLRELGCNAADAHIAAGIAARPIEVKLPSKLDRDFYIKDFGGGLTHEEIEDLYTTYFSSNKSTNNEQTGAFGLGSKSPFSYTDTFAVTTVQDGLQRTYTAYIDAEEGAPVISLLDQQAASDTWPHGLMVSFPVKPEDIGEFERKAAQVFKWFQVKPVYPGLPESPYKDPPRTLTGSNFYFVAGGSLGSTGGSTAGYSRYAHHTVGDSAHVLSGNVAYPLNAGQLECDEEFVKVLVEAGIQLRMPIGTVMPTASREALEYDPRTRDNLVLALRQAAAEIGHLLRNQLNEPAANDWERRHRAHRLLDTQVPSRIASDLSTVLSVTDLTQEERERVTSFYQTRSMPLPSWVGGDVFKHNPAPAGAVATFTSELDRASSYRVWWAYNQQDPRKPLRRHAIVRGMTKIGKTPEKACVSFSQQLTVLFSDCTHAYQRVEALVRKNASQAILMVAPAYSEAQAGLEAYAERLAEALGGVSVAGISTLPLPTVLTRAKEAAASRPKLKASEKAAAYARERVHFWEARAERALPSRIEFAQVPEDSRYYLPASSTQGGETAYQVSAGSFHRAVLQSDLKALVQAFRSLRAQGVPLPDIGGFITPEGPQARKFKLKENGWKSLLDTICECLSDPAIIEAIQSRTRGQPDLDLTNRYQYRRLASGAGFLGTLITWAHQHSEHRDWLTQRETQLPALATLTQPLWDSNVLSECNASADMPLQCLLNTLGYSSTLKFERMGSDGYLKGVYARHPELRFLSEESFAEAWNEDPEGASRLLQLIFQN